MRKRWTGEMVKSFVENEGYELVSVPNEEWVKNADRIVVSCGNHKPYETRWGNFQSNRRCNKCASKNRSEKKSFSHEDICRKINELDKNYFVCDDSPRYENNITKLKLSCGEHEYFACWADFMSSRRCPKCSDLKRSEKLAFSHEHVAEKIQELDSEYSICEDSPRYEKKDTKLKLYHSVCKNEFYVAWNEFRNGDRPCGCYTYSKTEILLRDYLKSKRINFSEQVTFDGLVSERKLRYDFGIYRDGELLCLIEFDGIQHFKAIKHFGGQEKFIKTQHHDKLKNDYARKNNIPLLRIRYDEDTIFVLENYLKDLQLIKEDDIINLTKEEE